MKKLFALAILLLGQFHSIFAQNDTTSAVLDDVVITAQRKAQKQELVPFSTNSINASFLENYQPRTTPEVLMGAPGVFVQKTNHGGGSPFLRGLTGNQTLTLVDGIRLNNSTFRYGPNQYFNTIDPYSIQKIEVVKGTGSVQYGTDALGGVLQIFTKDPRFSTEKPMWSGSVLGKYMTGDMEKTIRAESGFSAEKFAAQIGATYRNFGHLIGGDTTGKQTPSGYKEFAFDAKVKFQLKPKMVLTLANQFLQQHRVPVYHRVVLENFAVNEFDPQLRMLNYAKLNIETNNRFANNIAIITSWQKSIEGRNSRKNGSNILRKERDEVNTAGFTIDVSSRFSKIWTANSGVEIYLDKVNSTREDINTQNRVRSFLRGLYPDGANYANHALYSMHHFQKGNWLLEGGIRLNSFSIRIVDTTLGSVKITPSSFVYNGAIMYNLNQQNHVYVTVSSGYRAPNIDDLGTLGIVDFRYEIPTASLKPERSINTEVGYKVRTSRFNGSFSAYYMHLKDLITRLRVNGQIINGYQVYSKENTEKAYIKGFEAALNYELSKSLYASANLSYTYGQSLSRPEPLRRIPPMFGKMLVGYHKQKWFVSAETLFAGKQDRLAQGDKDDNRIPAGGTPGWKIINAFGGISFQAVKINLGLQNLFNEDYRTHGSGINGVGRSGWLSVLVSI